MTYVDKNGNKFLIYPVTKAELVDGLDEAIQAFMASLNYDDRYYTEAEIDQKLQGLPPAGHKHTKSDITDFPALGTAAAKNVGDFATAIHTHNYTLSTNEGGAANKANKQNIPVFGSEIEQVKIGCLAAEGLDYVALGKQTGKMAAEILKGEKKASEMNFETITEPGFYVNEKVAENLGVTVPQDLADEAVESFTEITK